MGKHRFFLPSENFVDGRAYFPVNLQSQIKRVLRLKPGDEIEVLDGSGRCFQAGLQNLEDGSLVAKLGPQTTMQNEPVFQLTLNTPLTNRDKFEWILQKGTEIGVRCFQPIICSRSLVQSSKDFVKKSRRWLEIIREAAEQSGRSIIPEINPPLSFEKALHQALSNRQNVLVALIDQHLPDLKSALQKCESEASGLHLFSGPEGGFHPSEIALMQSTGAIAFQLGKRILRMETAAIVSASLILYEMGEMSA